MVVIETSVLVKISVAINDSVNVMNDEQLVSAAKAGDPIAFVELSKRYSNKILWKIYRITRNWQDAEDVLQDSLLKAFTHLKDFECRSSFSVWLTRIAINSALMSLRKKRDHVEIPIDRPDDNSYEQTVWEPRDLADDPESRYVKRERDKLIREAILRLPHCYRVAFELQHAEGYSMSEIAYSLGISMSAAKSRLSRARTVLRTSLI
jgi:RNA polymerase sigma-70 factor, ECF subfamily